MDAGQVGTAFSHRCRGDANVFALRRQAGCQQGGRRFDWPEAARPLIDNTVKTERAVEHDKKH